MRKTRKQDLILFFIGLFLFLGIGYAFLTTDLSINGTATMVSNSWNIYFDNLVVQNGSVPIGTGDTAASITGPTTISFAVTLTQPGDYYEFLVDIVNDGTLPGVISSIDVTPATALNSNIFGYSYTYTNGKVVKVGDIVDPSDSKTTKFRVFYNDDIEEDDLSATDVNQLLTVSITFEQSDTVEKKTCTYNGELTQGAEYVDGQYTYHYMQQMKLNGTWENITDDGWGFILTDKESTDPVTTQMCASINGKPIVSGQYAFYGSQTTNIDLTKLYTSDMTNMRSFFRNVTIPHFDGSLIDTSNVTNMHSMFSHFSSDDADFSNFDTSNVVDMTAMFSFIEISSLDLSHLDTSKVTTMNQMFYGCNIDHLNLSGLGGSQLTNMSWMFEEATLGDINFTGFNSSHVTDMNQIFRSTNMDTISVPLDTSNVTNFSSAFESTLASIIDISTFDTHNATNMLFMFYYARNVTTIYVGSNFSTASLQQGGLFGNNLLLVGGQGTVCSSASDSYARIDNPPGAPGCFTAKP